MYRVSQKKVPTFANSWNQEYFTDLNDLNSSWKSNDWSIFLIFLTVLPALKVSQNLTLATKISWLQNDWKVTQNVDQIVRIFLTQKNMQWTFHLSQDLYHFSFQTNS